MTNESHGGRKAALLDESPPRGQEGGSKVFMQVITKLPVTGPPLWSKTLPPVGSVIQTLDSKDNQYKTDSDPLDTW